MGTLDVSLISAFANVPAFYNKSNPHFKDKEFIEQAWEQISKDLGYDMAMLKDRIYQLRNRYNLEKRKVLASKDDGIRHPKSTWPLFGNLKFLDSHIRPRKSYKGMMRKEGLLFDTYKDNDLDYVPNGIARVNAPRRGRPPLIRKEIKNEGVLNDVSEFQREYETEDEGGNDTENADDFLNPARFLEDTESENNDVQVVNDSTANFSDNGVNIEHHKPSLTVRNINSLKRSLQDSSVDNSFIEREGKIHKASDKYEAFGNFVAASLQDMPENKSLELIERFTNDIVRNLINA